MYLNTFLLYAGVVSTFSGRGVSGLADGVSVMSPSISSNSRRLLEQTTNNATTRLLSDSDPMYSYPQGLGYDQVQHVLVIADTSNDAIRMMNLKTGECLKRKNNPNLCNLGVFIW